MDIFNLKRFSDFLGWWNVLNFELSKFDYGRTASENLSSVDGSRYSPLKRMTVTVKHREELKKQKQMIDAFISDYESKKREFLRLSDEMRYLMAVKESFERQLNESENERQSLLHLVDMSNNLIANYETLIANYRTNLESSKREVEALKASYESMKKTLEESERRERKKQKELDALKLRLKKESEEKGFLFKSLQEMFSIIEQYQNHIQIMENVMVDNGSIETSTNNIENHVLQTLRLS